MCCANVSTTIFVPKLQLVGHVSPCVMFPLLAACADSDVAKVPLGSTVVHGASTQLGGSQFAETWLGSEPLMTGKRWRTPYKC